MEFINLEKVDSTNLYAKEHIETLDDRTVILTKEQTAGRGRLNRSWIDLGKNNVFMSIVLKPSETYQEVYSNITQYLSVVLCHALEDYGLKPQIKWPNDVLVNGKKIAGILSESVIQGTKFKGLVLGVGVNLNATDEGVKSITDKEVTALNLELNKEVVYKDFLNKLLDEFFKNYDKFLKNGFIFIKDDYISRNSFLGKDLKVQVLNRIEEGLATSITDNGELILKRDNKEFVLTIGDIL